MGIDPIAPRIALVMGDPAGISPELTAKLLAMADVARDARILIVGERRVLADGERVAGVSVPLAATISAGEKPTLVQGKPTLLDLRSLDSAETARGVASAAGGRFAMANFKTALQLARDGAVDAICFTPFNKAALKLGGNPYEDELQFAADVLGHRGPCSEFNILDRLWNARVTSHVPLSRVAQLLTTERIVSALTLTDACMRRAGVAHPRIAVAGFNPHAGDGGNFGREEIDVIGPAIAAGRARQVNADGPFPADTVFVRARRGDYDAVLTMFHDQGQIAMKLLGFERGVTLLGGLPVPICTPAHGTAYDIAGKGVADATATHCAFMQACIMGRARAEEIQAA
ncbi:MAG: 4-hydroxythreonine-4-phosphate dehydrogenase PdxA [Proteobacteria bacterium]|nr:4-hydroxythreonine-4-phosphate dehydrogenase PdxA [Pseudomonadota bacterium]